MISFLLLISLTELIILPENNKTKYSDTIRWLCMKTVKLFLFCFGYFKILHIIFGEIFVILFRRDYHTEIFKFEK